MKKLISILLSLFILSAAVFAETEGDEYDDGYVYEMNGAGDQFLKVDVGGLIPLNFNGQLHMGGIIGLGYYRFINKIFGVGGEFSASYNLTIGNKLLLFIPVTFGVVIQPTVGNFEFPVTVSAGFGYETFQSLNYFPSPAVRASAGAYYRLNDVCSLGVAGGCLWLPEYTKDYGWNHGVFSTVTVNARYHF
ncbi:MAG: hypothetical protein MJ162_06105 [Treponema sp.]|nr:hypothetical protein [Treponema sp.]